MVQYQCVECGGPSPEANGLNTLIGDLGWRLLWLRSAVDQRLTSEWRCPDCWRKYKEAEARRIGAGLSTRSSGLPGLRREEALAQCATCGEPMPPQLDPLDTAWFRHGWRISRMQLEAGQWELVFFCPGCWSANAGAPSSGMGSREL